MPPKFLTALATNQKKLNKLLYNEKHPNNDKCRA